MNIIDPLSDNRWDDLVDRHPCASVFHRRGWLRALARSYGYEVRALTSAPAGRQLDDGMVFCRVSSWLTGTRLVSLPFADHCEPLLNQSSGCFEFVCWLHAECDQRRWKYVEFRPVTSIGSPEGMHSSRTYYLHELDLTPGLEQIFQRLHKDSIQRKIRRAEGQKMGYEVGRSKYLLDQFYQLLLLTRRRHRAIPQPRRWFENLADCMGDSLQIRVARKDGTPIAAMLTLRHGTTAVYKYGCSDGRLHKLGAMPFLFWRLIEETKNAGGQRIDFGRTDVDNHGLVTFKDKFGTMRKLLTYYRYPQSGKYQMSNPWTSPMVRHFVPILPDVALSTAGRLLYRHFA
jgi:hypothetical protein